MPDNKTTTPVVAVGEKCDDSVIPEPYSPFGGATSFGEIDASKAGQDYAMQVDQLTFALEGIVHNISISDETSADEKAASISAAASDYRDRINALKVGQEAKEGLWEKFKGLLFLDNEKRNYSAAQREEMAKNGQAKSDGSFPIKDTTDLKNAIRDIGRGGNNPSDKAHIKKRAAALGATDSLPEDWKSLDIQDRGFKVYEDSQGQKRWLALSSNAFEDYDKELFTTKALEEAIEYADKTNERGPLLVFHVPSAEIGQCDYQAMAGRFLVESGTFDNTPLGRKAVEYYSNTDEEHQVSIGYQYIKGDELDGQYDWMRFKERSVLPYGTAANPWTDFAVIGDDPMEEIKALTLRKIFGEELANGVIANAETKTKELEASGTRFKEKTAPMYDEKELGPITDVETVEEKKEEIPVLSHIHGNVKHTHRVAPDTEHAHTDLPAFKAKKTPAADAEDKADGGVDDDEEDANGKKKPPFAKKEGEIESPQMTELAGLLATLVEDVGAVRGTVTALTEEVKALKVADEEKQRELNIPRGFSFPGGIRPSESAKNLVTDEKTIEGLDKEEDTNPISANPAFAYVQDLLQPGARIASN